MLGMAVTYGRPGFVYLLSTIPPFITVKINPSLGVVVGERCLDRRKACHGLARPTSLWPSDSHHLLELRQCNLKRKAFKGNQIEYRHQLAGLETVDLLGHTGMRIDLAIGAHMAGETSRLESHLMVKLI
jgi:hypothetical protein